MKTIIPIPNLTAEQIERFWKNVDADGICWEWTGSTARGYGAFAAARRRLGAHRVAYTILVGEIPAGLVIDHRCRNTLCVNPDHLEPVTNRENVNRGARAISKYRAGSACPNGHAMTEDNIAYSHGKPRGCKACNRETWRDYMREYMRTYYHKRKAAALA